MVTHLCIPNCFIGTRVKPFASRQYLINKNGCADLENLMTGRQQRQITVVGGQRTLQTFEWHHPLETVQFVRYILVATSL